MSNVFCPKTNNFENKSANDLGLFTFCNATAFKTFSREALNCKYNDTDEIEVGLFSCLFVILYILYIIVNIYLRFTPMCNIIFVK